jgi:predicted metal-dependent enzyme (double-stranded beta helix superfamily)
MSIDLVGRERTMTVISPVRTRCPADLLTGIRTATQQHADWQRTAELVADQLRLHLPGAEILTAAERAGDPDGYRCHVLHVEPDGSFSLTALVWRPGQVTPIHDHVTWCVFGVIKGTEYEELYALSADGSYLDEVGRSQNDYGEVSGFAPPGDIHRVRNIGADVAVSLHVYGADITRLGSSVRRIYELPVAGPAGT